MSSPVDRTYSFGRWLIDCQRRELKSDNVAVPIDSRAFEIPEKLGGSAGALVAKDDLIRRVQQHGFVSILGRSMRLCRAFAGKSVAFRPTDIDGVFDAWFRHQKIETIDLNTLAR